MARIKVGSCSIAHRMRRSDMIGRFRAGALLDRGRAAETPHRNFQLLASDLSEREISEISVARFLALALSLMLR